MLNVHRSYHAYTVIENLVDVLPSFLILAARGIRVCQFINDYDFVGGCQNRRKIELFKSAIFVIHTAAGYYRQVLNRCFCVRTAMGFNISARNAAPR